MGGSYYCYVQKNYVSTFLKVDLTFRKSFTFTNNVFYQKNLPVNFQNFEQSYTTLRKRENRLFNDETVRRLPDFSTNHPLTSEWQIRKKSWKRFARYLRSQESCQTILEVGCGNGWMTKELAALNKEVCAIDVHEKELLQAARLFNSDSISFVYGDVFTLPLDDKRFDLIILASSVQYFEDLQRLLQRLTAFSKPHGEIHILDSPIYRASELDSAKKRSESYFAHREQPEMTLHYFHHSYEELQNYKWKFLNRPNIFTHTINALFPKTNTSPFPWIRIQVNGPDL